MPGLVPGIHVFLGCLRRGWPGHLARRRASRFRPAMTATIIRVASEKLRPPTKCQQLSLRLRPGRIVEETLAENLVAAPLLQRDLVDPVHFAGFIGELENPVNGDIIAVDQ
jgi:hypothetical protein